MKGNKKKSNILLIIILLCGLIVVGLYIRNKNKEKRLAEVATLYYNVNNTFNSGENYYVPLELNIYNESEFRGGLYVYLEYYRQQTKANFFYEDVIEYFSQEYEDDGTLRLYNNGLHSEMEAYIYWVTMNYEEQWDYFQEISRLHREYCNDHENEGFEYISVYGLSREMMDELIKKQADPEYEMDLMSIQQRERAEAETQEVA